MIRRPEKASFWAKAAAGVFLALAVLALMYQRLQRSDRTQAELRAPEELLPAADAPAPEGGVVLHPQKGAVSTLAPLAQESAPAPRKR